MGHLKQSIIEMSLSEETALHRFIGAISTVLTSDILSDSQKVIYGVDMVRDFNECFPSKCLDLCLGDSAKTKGDKQP